MKTGVAMSRLIRARVRGGVLEPLEDIQLPEGQEVTLTISDEPSRDSLGAFRRAAGGWKGTIDAEALIRHIYAGRRIATRPGPRL
jgi:predicted DNA-binding antitoxin AbrB/MazE fold protein